MNLHHIQSALTECDREPIHHIAAVQPFGALFAVDAAGIITQASLNAAGVLDLAAAPAVAAGTMLSDWFTAPAIAELREAFARAPAEDGVERLFGLDLTGDGRLFDCAVHPSARQMVVEFEPHAVRDFADHLGLIGPVISQLERLREPQALCDTAARLVRQMLGYDRVMVYRFHPDESGEVIAEDKRDDLAPFLGLRYPAADIPKQARELFRRNRFRVIADMAAEAVPIEPAVQPDGTPLDLSMSVLRAHSKMHLAYMRNMGVGASLTIAIVRHERLWGMISCHHETPRLPPFSLRTVAELFSQTFSLMLDRMLVRRAEKLREHARDLNDQLMLELAGGTSLAANLPLLEQSIGDLIAHDGMSLLAGGEYRALGAAPTREEFMALAPALGEGQTAAIFTTTQLAEQVPAASIFAERATGAMILPLSRSPRDFLVLWRRPVEQVVIWAGDPDKAKAPAGTMLEPRASFAAWREIVRGRSAEWSEEECDFAERLRRTLIEVILRMSEEVMRERQRAAEQQDLLIAELNHRVRNILGLIRGLVAQSQHDAMSVAGFAAIIGGRISALASAHDNITRENWSPAPLSLLIESEFAAYLGDDRNRLKITGEDVLIRPEAFTVMALVVHELVTNSAKYGSLSARSGMVTIDLSRSDFGDLRMAWREAGGPPVTPPGRQGFGSTIIQRSIPHELQGEAEMRFRLTGLEADFLIPRRFLTEPGEHGAPMQAAVRPRSSPNPVEPSPVEPAAPQPARPPRPGNVLIVEDSMIIALDTEENLKRLGVPSVRVESSVAGALQAIAEGPPDFAIIDFNLGNESSAPVAAALRARGVRFLLATGYAESASEMDRLGAAGVLRKPYGRSDLERALSE
jgi:light-regulated signal transduction histidine kinase (bacteriophytochrome)/CheY-like chemotaxis protein